ncbi:MAG: HEAT repeat domain-containing protein [Desulfobacterales bacterium]
MLIHLIPLPLLALLWFTQFDNEMFLDLRDNLLLSNFYGKKFSDFYYTYTLYPAEAFKALHQKIIKTSALKDINSRSIKMKLERKLIDNDYLPLNDVPAVNMVVRQLDDHFVFEAQGRQILDASLNQFLSEPRNILRSFSEKTDRQAVFRQLTFLSILVGFPVLIYILLHAVFYFPAYYAMGRKPATLAASIICLLLGIMVFAYFQANRSSNIRIQNIAEALRSDRWQIRVAALKLIQKKELDIALYPEYQHLINSGISQQRYWLAKTLAYSRQPETIDDLLKFLHDKNLNVRTMALYSLGLRKDPRAIRPVLKKIEDSESWYCQMYAYKALRTLGWKQTKFH